MIGTTVVPYNLFIHAASAGQNWSSPDELELSKMGYKCFYNCWWHNNSFNFNNTQQL